MISGIDPKVDYAFKRLFGHESNVGLLTQLLNAILHLSGDQQLATLTILNPFNDKEFEDDKLSILDIKAQDKTGRFYLIEMQLLVSGFFRSHVLYYWARAYQGQLPKGKHYRVLKPTISICFVNTPLFPELPGYHHIFELREREHGVVFTEQMRLHILELSKFSRQVEELLSPEDRWLYFLRHGHELDEAALPATLELPEMRRALGELVMMSKTELERERYESRLKAQRDQASALDWVAEGAREEGREEGRQEGRQAGLSEGATRTKISDLLRVLSRRFKTSVPADLDANVRAVTDIGKIDSWLDASLDAASLEDFRRINGI